MITPATIKALSEGDIENALVSMTPGGIEIQEKKGQVDFVASATLPKPNMEVRLGLEALGVVFGKEVDDLFIEAQLPEGWEKEATDHSMWSLLKDNSGKEIAAIFYKAAFYDRRAHIEMRRNEE